MEIEFAKSQAQLESLKLDEEVDSLELEADDDSSPSDIELDSEQEKRDRDAARLVRARREFERRLDEKLKQNRISVRLTNWDSKKIYVLGVVNSPGSFLFKGNETVLDAIIEAGGMGNKANRHNIIVSRPSSCGDCRTVMKVCYDQIVQLGDASTNYQLMPGDRVFVPSLTFMDEWRT